MIVIRLLMYRAEIRKLMGDRHSAKYGGMASMLIESLTLLSSFSVFFLVAYTVESPAMVMMPFILTQIQVSL